MRIMAVTSESLQLRALMRKIRKAVPGAKLTGIRFPKDAIAHMGENAADAAFLDMELPEMHGLILAKKLQQMNPAVNIIFIAAMDDGYMESAFKMHASGFLLKPFDDDAIARELRNLRYPVP